MFPPPVFQQELLEISPNLETRSPTNISAASKIPLSNAIQSAFSVEGIFQQISFDLSTIGSQGGTALFNFYFSTYMELFVDDEGYSIHRSFPNRFPRSPRESTLRGGPIFLTFFAYHRASTLREFLFQILEGPFFFACLSCVQTGSLYTQTKTHE